MAAPRFDPSITRRDALREVESLLQHAGVGEPSADAGILVEDALGLTRSALRLSGHLLLGSDAARSLEVSVARRLAREPVFRIIGRREFWGLDLAIDAAVLDPRPDTETIVSAALRALSARRAEPLRILDLGTGSGAILLALLTELPGATGLGIDVSDAACAMARANVADCRMSDRAEIRQGVWTDRLSGRFDLIVSNPPYIETAVIDTLEPEVRQHDPRLALDGGPDGLDAYRAICPAVPAILAESGVLVLEIGAGQASDVSRLIERSGMTMIRTERDLGGHDRALVAGWPTQPPGTCPLGTCPPGP
ncbi:peptide chain release factor N(5)-glutamine methyltransferase [Lichenihabitans psoromatis]|uniref:peptide chain release factor N(5)-glutamine methyltransferase n=1 Tax=Lichenihabitans psoromatis TaxID=2528642 RepID=UPI00103609C0|nr:peptide chain release factor N(5)-glutamine methyltransferase [Lichenihabitans psoromatis]